MTGRGNFNFLGVEVEPGGRVKTQLELGDGPAGNDRNIPVYIMNGEKPGPVLALVAGVHGDELNGVSVVHHLIHGDDHIAGTDDDFISLF